uniref:Uncharacterized protein n=1 Tax=Arundo donax TaxID=35708 RepID=A0A0A9UIG6_ARUDO
MPSPSSSPMITTFLNLNDGADTDSTQKLGPLIYSELSYLPHLLYASHPACQNKTMPPPT